MRGGLFTKFTTLAHGESRHLSYSGEYDIFKPVVLELMSLPGSDSLDRKKAESQKSLRCQ